MKNILKISILSLILFMSVFSCNEQENTPVQQSIDYQQFAQELSNNLNSVASNLRMNNYSFSDTEHVKQYAKEALTSNYASGENVIGKFSTTYDYTSALIGNLSNARSQKDTIRVSQFQFDVLNKIGIIYETAQSQNEYVEGLTQLISKVSLSDVSEPDKTPMLIHLTSQLVAINFIQENLDLLSPESQIGGRTQGWWDDWGKCAAGIVGGAGTVGLGGFLGGAGVGTVTLPVIGTVSGAILGGVGGAIFGGIAGAAASCGGGGGCGDTRCYEIIVVCTEAESC